MSENLGSIYWNVDADTTGAISSEKALAAQTVKVEKQLKSLDTTTTKTAKSVKKGMASMSRGAGQAGVQMQQFIGQVQGGQSVMLAFSQQIADVGIVLGAPLLGAIAGISASLAGILLPSLMNSKTATEELEAALELIKDITYETSDGTLVLSDSMEKLAKKSKALAEIEIALGMVNAQKAIKAATNEINDASDDWESAFSLVDTSEAISEIENLEKIAKRTGLTQVEVMKQYGDTYTGAVAEITVLSSAVESIAEEYGATDLQALGFLKTLKSLKETKSPESMAAVAAAVHSITTSLKEPNEKLLTLDKRLNSAALSAMSAKDMIKLLESASKDMSKALGNSSESVAKNRDQIDEMIKSLENQLKMMRETDRWTALRIAKEKGATAEQLKAIATVYTRIEAEEERIKKVKELEKEEAEAAKNAEKRAAKEEKEFLAKIKRNGKQWQKKNEERQGGLKFAKETMQPEGENDAITQLQEEHAKLLELKAKFVEDSLIYDQALTANTKAQAQERTNATISGASLIAASMGSLFGNIASMMAASGDEQSTAYKAMFAVSKGFAVAQAGLNFALAVSNASAVTPWYSSLAAVAETTAAGAGVVSAVSSAVYSGREHGGSVNAGQTYEVGEKNKPEMLMIPGNNGKVFSNAEMKGMMGGNSGGSSSPIINNYAAGGGVSVEHSRDQLTQQDVFNIVYSENTNPNSRSRRGQASNSNMSGKLGSSRRS